MPTLNPKLLHVCFPKSWSLLLWLAGSLFWDNGKWKLLFRVILGLYYGYIRVILGSY